jgi:hypothetical protein
MSDRAPSVGLYGSECLVLQPKNVSILGNYIIKKV